jgi:hypothetical protein
MLEMPNSSDVLAGAKLEPGNYDTSCVFCTTMAVQLCAPSPPPWFAAHKHRVVCICIHFLRIISAMPQCYLTGAFGKSEVNLNAQPLLGILKTGKTCHLSNSTPFPKGQSISEWPRAPSPITDLGFNDNPSRR